MRKKEYEKLVEELQSDIERLKEQLKYHLMREMLQNRYVASLPYGKNLIECPNCKENTFSNYAGYPYCFLCSYPRPTQGSIEKWMENNNVSNR